MGQLAHFHEHVFLLVVPGLARQLGLWWEVGLDWAACSFS